MKNEFEKYAVKHKGISSLNLHRYNAAMGKKPIIGYNAAAPVVGMTPNVIEERKMNAIALSVFDRLMMDRIIFLGLPIDSMVANVVNAQLLFLESVDSERDISIYLNTPGGEVYAGLGIYDLMQYIRPDVITVTTGIAASMGSVLLCAGTSGKRSALKHSRVMIHQPSSGMEGTMSDMEISLAEGIKLKKELYEIISLHSGQPFKKVEKDSDRDYWMTAEEAKNYGLVDNVLEKKKK
jgi:ATP-dependent Clp protease protease subunit